MGEKRLVLDREDFGLLVRGRAVRRDGVGVLLADIGFLAMTTELGAAIRGAPNFRLPGERKATAETLLRTWHDASVRVREDWSHEAVDDVLAASQAIDDWCRQEFGDE